MPEEHQEQPVNPEEKDQQSTSSKIERIKLLRETIQRLEGIVDKLDAEEVEELPPVVFFATLVSTTEELEAELEKTQKQEVTVVPEVSEEKEEAIAPKPETEIFEAQAEPEQELITEKQGIDRFLPSFTRFQNWWDGILTKIRSILPTPINNFLSDWALTGVLTGIVVILLLTSVLLLPQEPSEEIVEVVEKPKTETTEVVKQPETEAPSAEIETPPELIAPARPEPVEIIPPPEPELTPEQSLVAAIQEQVADITNRYSEDLIQSIEANFFTGRLQVNVSENWYQLKNSRQDKLANEMLRRSRQLDFKKLEITDPQGTLIARNPVVGDTMVIFQRQK